MKIKIGFSPCPNDTYIFDAMINQRIPTGGIDFEPVIADVEELNQRALNHELHVTKLSYHAYAHVSSNYQLLTSGGALGKGNGPLLISKRKIYPDEMSSIRIAVPGMFTTAVLLLRIAFPGAENLKEYLFSDIEEALLGNEADAGLIIHETRFTYQKKGLKKIMDLGDFWEQRTSLPIPLGGIAVSRDLPKDLAIKINELIQASLEHANTFPKEGYSFVKRHAQELDDRVIEQHIQTYVNNYSWNIGKDGKRAVEHLYQEAGKTKNFPQIHRPLFVDEN